MSEKGLEYRKGAVILLLLVLFLSVNIIALFIYFSAGSEKIQAKQALKVLDNQVSLESAYINNLENNLENITEIIDSFYSGNSNHKSTNSNSHSISTYSLNIICGNGINEQGEECDDGNKDDYDGCTNLCDFDFSGLLHCGDNKTDSGEQCDLGKDNGKKCIPGYNTTCTYCSILCRNKTLTRFCGDNILDSEEECDDGNNLNWDGCSAYCTVEPECCGDSDCPDDKNSSGYCYNNDIYKNLTDYFCEYHNCLFNTTKIFVQDCNNESYSDNYCYDNNVYVNHTSGGCETGECILITNPEKVENCGNNSYMEVKYCYDNDVWINKSQELRGCEQGECFYSPELTIELFSECGTDYCESWSNYFCEAKNRTRTRTCYDKGCSQSECFNNPDTEKQTYECDYGCNNGECTEQGCEHDVGIRYSYVNSFGTGIAIKLNGTDEWLEDPVELKENQTYIIKYIIDNKIENTTNNIHVIVKIRNTIIADYNVSINQQHAKEISFKPTHSILGFYNLSVSVEKINEIDCNLTDNHAEREITINPECCFNTDCPKDKYSDNYCMNNNVWRNFTDYFCNYGTCLFNLTKELFIDCGNETYSDEYCYDNDVYQNHSLPGCENAECVLSNEVNKIQECGIDSCNSWSDYVCEGKNRTRTRTCYDKGCSQSECFNNPDTEKQSQECEYDCANGECVERENLTIIAHKIICDYETDLPNWGLGGPNITENTALNFIASHPDCHFEENWKFQWAYAPAPNPGDHVGQAGGKWNTFDPTNSDGKAVEIITNLQQAPNLWIREVFKQGYIDFTYNKHNKTNIDNISAEFYCHTDVLNYDNYDRIDSPESGKTYYCIAFNVLEQEEPECGDGIINGNEQCEPPNTLTCDANCMNIRCNNDLDCGIDAWLNQDYCVCTTNVWDFWKIYECKNPGTSQSYCTNSTEIKLKQECGKDNCTNWENYCYDNDVYKNQTCYDRGCRDNSCFEDITLNISLVQECGIDSCNSWSDYVCEGKNRTRTRTCYDKGCMQSACFNNPNLEKQSQECEYDCANGECVERENLTIIAHKIICDYETDLPDWGLGGPNITENTASDFIATHPDCHFEENWNFQWAYASNSNPGDHVGQAGGKWNTFDPTDSNGKAVEIINNLQQTPNLWLREVFQDGYIDFTYNKHNKTNIDNISAELYCHTDVLNYDNYDMINSPESGKTYYCIAFNVLKPECCDDNDCPDDKFNNFCYYNDVYKNLTDYFCKNGKCLFNISNIFFQDCGENEYKDWDYYCKGKEVWKNKTDILRGCSSAECFENSDYKNEYVESCEQECVNGECKGECETDSDCPADYYEPGYCGGNTCPQNVFKNFHDFSCNSKKKCVETITPELIEKCDFTCIIDRCVNSDCDGIDLSNCLEWVDCVCVAYKETAP